ncbi:MAG: flavin reductase family protein [Anaerolineae bacterium]
MSEGPKFREINPHDLTENAISLIGKEWMLITAGKLDHFNMMTASWGTLGYLWNRPVAFAFVRPQRYTFGLMEQSSYFSLTFFDEEHRDVLDYCGSHSGRDVDKVAKTGLTPMVGESGAVYFDEARLVMECRKIYAQDITEANFLEATIIAQHYQKRDFHRLYVGEITRVLTRD